MSLSCCKTVRAISSLRGGGFESQCDAYCGLIVALELVKETVLLGVILDDANWAFDKYSVHHVGKLTIVAIGDKLDDHYGMSDGGIMSKQTCGKIKSIVSFQVCDIATVRSARMPDSLTVCPATHDGNLGWVFGGGLLMISQLAVRRR